MKIFALASVLAPVYAKITSSALRAIEQDATFTAFVTFKGSPAAETESAAVTGRKQTLSEIVGDRKVKAFWITNAATVENVDRALADKIAKLDNVLKVDVVKTIKLSPVLKKDSTENSPIDNSRPTGIQWGVKTIGATDVWKTTKGEGIVVGSIDTGKKNLNEKFWYNFDDKSIQSQTKNTTCLDVYQDVQGKNQVRLYTCTGGSAQKWDFEPNSHSLRHLAVRNLCLESAHATPGAAPFVADCTGGVSQWFTKCEEAPAAKSYAISEFYSGVYANWASDTANELFTYDSAAKTLQAASNGQCLDAYRDGNKFGLHTYACDATNGNQKWIIDAGNHKIKHATHNNLCLDVDPTNPAHAAQVWECHNANTNQWIDAVKY
ncbi:hypothetical protein SPRG_22268 [Saprolegnia parasitica CBS 223.65]|uniref:Ricin B lectin domain-containing protein n=1 Tax=Saprolegnia parasitica (strain CBS 223.65) TaxID=695850 RepID=A0A067C0U2_SAPPC|nr:hypothetical protein SPRG_22268 [Saprolegnia parasitica CBS 223.65]KDO22695.1 hypothetical protein SPRG_22268 [Saprolegnia parasitica CBS 223.65]|eukprot:XP_012206633.1 hypothetical protein SPRG_22268 [Saprolegnia parasitica CBS 223.65]